MLRSFIAACFLSLLSAVAMAQTVTEFSGDDPQMNAAIADARDTLPLFLSAMAPAGGALPPGASVKVSFPDTLGGNEIIWVDTVRWDGGQSFQGRLANQPRALGEWQMGTPVTFTMGQIQDWAYWGEDGLAWGHYTTRIIAERIEGGEALLSRLQPVPLPVNWR